MEKLKLFSKTKKTIKRKIVMEVACLLFYIFRLKEKSENSHLFKTSRKSAILQSSLTPLKTQQESKLLCHKSLTKNVGCCWWALIKPNLIHKRSGQTGKKFASRQKDAGVIWFAFCNLVQQSDFHSSYRYKLFEIFFELKRMNKSNMSC